MHTMDVQNVFHGTGIIQSLTLKIDVSSDIPRLKDLITKNCTKLSQIMWKLYKFQLKQTSCIIQAFDIFDGSMDQLLELVRQTKSRKYP